MSKQNIKLHSDLVRQLKHFTQEKTGQGAVETALEGFLKIAKQKLFIKKLKGIEFKKNFNPLVLRNNDR